MNTDEEILKSGPAMIVKKIYNYLPSFNENRFLDAYNFAYKAHSDQKRRSGEPYIIHPLKTAGILSNLRADENTLIAALLHDVPEDTEYSIEQIESLFGQEVAFLVDGITKLAEVHYQHNMEERQVASLKKLLLHTAKDLRVVMIKLADRLHNMRTLDAISEERKRTRISKETLEIYVPIANLLGMSEIKNELQDLCFKYLYPENYFKLINQIKNLAEKKKKMMVEIENLLLPALKKQKIQAKIKSRKNTLYLIQQKIQEKGKLIPDLDDLLSFQIIVNDVTTCYQTLGIIHQFFKPQPGGVEDNISIPLANGHKQLKTRVFGLKGIAMEVLIITKKMNREYKYGILAPSFTNQKIQKSDESGYKKPWWAKRILDLQQELKDNKSFLEELKIDVFHDRIFTFTPKGDVIDLPAGANSLDFAYAIHTDIGHHAVRALVNQVSTSLLTPLKNGDSIFIIQDLQTGAPKREWLDYVQTNLAKKRMKEWFFKESTEHQIQTGKRILQRELDKIGEDLHKIIQTKRYRKILGLVACLDFNELFSRIAAGSLDPKEVLKQLFSLRKARSFETTVLGEKLGDNNKKAYRIWVRIYATDQVGLASRVLAPLAEMKINVHGIKTYTHFLNDSAVIKLCFDVQDFEELNTVFKKIEAVEGIQRIQTIMPRQVLGFYTVTCLAFVFWFLHPFMVQTLLSWHENPDIVSSGLFLFGILALFASLLFLNKITHKIYPEWKDTRLFWAIVFLLLNVASLTIIMEMILFEIELNWLIAAFSLAVCYSLFVLDYFKIDLSWGLGKIKKLIG